MSRLIEDMSSIPSTASTLQEGHESNSGSTSSRKLRVTLLSSEWRSTKGGLSTINRELAIQLAKHPSVEVSVYLPECSEDDKRVATSHNVHLIEAEKMPGLGPDLWLSCLPEDHAVDCVIGHGAVLGRQVQIIKRHHHCKWIQVVHTSPEELGMYKEYEEHISRGEEKHQVEVELCKLADQVVAVGPKLADAFSGYLRPCGKDQDVLDLTPGIFSEFADVSQATEERNSFNVLVFGRGDSEDFQLKGYDIAAQAIAELKDTTYKLVFVGATQGEEEKVARKLVEQGIDPSQLKERRFNESGKKLADLFCEVDLAVIPSRTEGFGLAALEALSAGLPVLVSGNSGLAEALKKVPHGSSCVVESEDPKDWANAIRTVRHKDREMRLGEFDFVRGAYAKKYSWKEQCDKLAERMKVISSEESSKRLQSLDKGKRPLSPSDTPASKPPRLLRYAESASETSATDPPQVSARQIRNKDLPAKSKPFGDCQIQVDILLLTVMKEDTCEDCEFLSCLAYLNPDFCKIHHPDLGYVYLGDMGEDDLKLNVAIMKCCEGSSSTGGSIVVVTSAVKVLKPKAVFCVGSCSGLNVTKVSLGDVVVLKKLVTYAFSKVTENGIEELGVKVPLKPHISKLILSAGEGWKPPLKDPGTLEVKIHRGTFLSGPEVINNHKRCNALIERFPEAVAIEREGEGVYAAAHNLDIEWVVIKGISGYADGRKVKDSWRAFASFMAASLTAHILSDTIAFQALPHYGSASSSEGLQPVKKGKTPLPPSGIPDPKHPRLSKDEGSKKGKRPLSSSNTPASKVPKCLGDEGRDSLVLVKLLRKEYKRRSQLRPLLWNSTIQLPIEQVYTRLKIVSRRKLAIQMEDDEEESDEEENVEEESDEEESDEEENDEKENDEVNVFDIFKVPDIGEDVMTIVEGSPGIGKTTFCLKLAYDWAHGNIPSECSFPKFEFVFLLKCRDINGDIMEAISEQLLPKDMDMEKSVEKLLNFMKDIHKQERLMLIILDGLDELPEQSRHHVDELLHRRILPFCFVLATTRQERGIEVRKSVVFDIHLEIKGYTESDSIAYIRRHFETIKQSAKGEKLIEEMQQNTFLHALRSNPLNLLLLCVVYEDYKGKLPTSRTELYQVIVRCLLRRYCGKRNLPAPKDDSVLEKTFEMEILALGELAWLCLLSDRYGFFETELDEFERKYPGLKARELDLLYMEESLKRLNPQHEYCFLHKTFQEYVAAAYIAQKLRNQKCNLFKHINISFNDIVTKYRQVFIFVSGMLGEKATVLFTEIGEELKKSYDWNWNKRCNEKTATFFIESFNETGHAEQMAVTLCNIIPFPKVITSELIDNYNASFFQVLVACRSFSNLRTPVELYADIGLKGSAIDVIDYMESYPQLTIVSFRVHDLGSLTSSDADRLCKWFSASKSLSEFTLKYVSHVYLEKYELLVQIGRGLASCRTLTKVTFALPGYAYNESFFNAFETGLTTLTSVNLVLWGSMKYTATRGLQHFLSNKSFNSLSLCPVGCVLDLLVAAVSQALARQTVLKSLDLHLDGPLSSSSASFLEKGLMENSSLNYLRLHVHGELPGNWYSVVENVRVAKKSPVCCSFYPNTFNNVANNNFRPVLVRKGLNVKQHLTVNVWGEMKCEAAEALCEVLAPSSITVLTLNMRGNLTSEVSNSIARCLEENKTLSSLSINIWGELITDGGNVPSSLSKNSRVQLNVHDVRTGPDESNDVLVTTTDIPAALTVFFTNVKERRKQNVRLTINNDSNVTKEWTRYLGDALAENPSLTTLDLTVNSCVVDADLGENLGNSLLQSSSLTSLSLTFNFSNMKEGWECKLGERLIKMASLTTLSLEINGEDEWNQKDWLSPTLSSLDYVKENQENCSSPSKLSNVLVAIKSLSTLSVAIHSDSMCSFWDKVVGDCLIKCTSLKKLSLTFNMGKADIYDCLSDLSYGLMSTRSLNTLCVAIFINDLNDTGFSSALNSLTRGLSLNSSVTTVTLTITVAAYQTDYIGLPVTLDYALSMNTSITTLNVTINECGDGESDIPLFLHTFGVFRSLKDNTSVTTFNLTLNSNKEVSDYWLTGLSSVLMANTTLTTLRLKVYNHCATGESRLYDFSKILIESRSLSLLELDVSFYGKESGCHKV